VSENPPDFGTENVPVLSVGPTTASGGSDIDRLQAENEQLKTTIRLQQAHRQITGELAKAGARSPELLFDAVKGEVKFTDDGKVENPKGLIDSVAARFPEQFGFEQPASIDAGAGTGGGNTLTREALAKMKPAEIARLDWADVRRVLSGS
jgi:hypothetical protein